MTQAGATCATPVSQVDFHPTFLAAARAPVPAGTQLDGVSLLPALKQPDRGLIRSSIFWHFPGYIDNPIRGRAPDFGSRPVSVIRKGDWKLHLHHEKWQLDGGRAALATNNAVELYNLRDDIGEHKNLALENTAKRDELLDDLLKWIADVKAPMPTQKNPAYDPNAKPGKNGGVMQADIWETPVESNPVICTRVNEAEMSTTTHDRTRRRKEVKMMRTILVWCGLLAGMASMTYGADAAGQERMAIDRQAVVSRHDITVNSSSDLQLGNDEFAITTDLSGLVSFSIFRRRRRPPGNRGTRGRVGSSVRETPRWNGPGVRIPGWSGNSLMPSLSPKWIIGRIPHSKHWRNGARLC